MPDIDICPNVDNLARILNRYVEDIATIQRYIIRLRIPSDEAEAEQLYSRYV